MVYPSFIYGLKNMSLLNLLVTYTTSESKSKYHRLRMLMETAVVVCSHFPLALHVSSTFLLAVQDKTEFLERLVESIIIFRITMEYQFVWRNRYTLIQLINEMKSKFSTADVVIVKKCLRAEVRYYFTFAAVIFGAFSFSIFEVIILSSKSRILKKGQLYHYKNPLRPIPANLYIPPALQIDLSVQPYYTIYLVMASIYGTLCLVSVALTGSLLGTFMIHIEGQYEMLLNKMQYIQHSYSVKEFSRKYYTNIIGGEYFRRLSNKKWIVYTHRLTSPQTNQFNQKCNQKIVLNQTEMKVISEILCDLESKESNHKYYTERNVMKDIREWAPKFKNTLQAHEESDHLYDEIVLKQIIQYHQFLLNYRKKVQNFLQPIVIPTCVVFILTVSVCLEIIASSEYKLAYILILAATILHFVNIVERSDTIDRSHRRIQQLLFFDTAWYRRSRRYRVLIKSAIQRCNRSEHFAFYGGFVTYDREFLLSLFVRSYNICNWLFYMRTKQG